MTSKDLPTPEELRKMLRYDHETGKFIWKYRFDVPPKWNTRWAGKPAFYAVDARGYFIGSIKSKKHRSHRVAWAMHYGQWPLNFIDHINGDTKDNRIANLREATASENAINSKLRSHNTSGVKGVYFCKRDNKWAAQIAFNGKRHHLGRFIHIIDAQKAYSEAAEKIHGEFANLS